MTFHLLWIRFVGIIVLTASFSLPCWSQEHSPTPVVSPAAGQIGLFDRVDKLELEVAKLKQKVQVDVPLGTMLPFFAFDFPEGGNWVWADGKTNWPNESWVPANLQGRLVPDMSNGLLVSGPRENVPNGQVWRNGFATVPAFELDATRNTLQVSSLRGVWPLSDFGGVFSPALDRDPTQGQHYARADFRDVIFVKTLTDQPSAEARKWIRDNGIGVDSSFVTYHPNGSPIRSDTYTNVPLSLDKIAQAKSKLNGTAFTKSGSIQLQTSDANPPSLVCRWIIRIR